MCQYLAHMASVPPDPQHNNCVGFYPWCPLAIHVQMLASGFWSMGSFTWKNALPRLGFELADLNRCPLSLCAFMYVNGSTCWLWPHFPLCLESLTGRVNMTLSFLLLEVCGHWTYWLVCWALVRTIYALSFVFLLTLNRKSGKVGSEEVMDRCWSLWQPLSPLGFDFGLSGASQYQ